MLDTDTLSWLVRELGGALQSEASSYDAVYVALAEALGAPFARLDQRLARTKGVACPFLIWAP